MADLPRILFLSNEAPHTAAAGAIIFHRLLQDYPADKLLVVTNSTLPTESGRLTCRYESLKLPVDRLNRTRLAHWRPILRALGGSALPRLGRVDALLRGFMPDVVVTLMQDSWFYDFAARYARARKLPLLLFIHDLAHGFEPVPSSLKELQLRRDRAVFQQAARRLCVSPGMTSHFQREFGIESEVCLPPRSDAPPTQDPEACRLLKTPGRLTLGYAGGLHYGYGEQLLQMLPILRETGTVVELFGSLPSGKVAALRNATDVLHFNGYSSSPEQAWCELLARCDAVLQPYLNPPGEHHLQYRTHFPSKLGDCLSLGLPLLITGPADASGVVWCLDHPGCALTVTSPGDLPAALKRLRNDADVRVMIARAAQIAAAAFASAPLRSHVIASLSNVAATH
ncbi:MAG: glycosyltransferase [Verrucomicrobia bacterium]|nr:glycosyltransferase [Verrucomicrobiota bacterium]